VTGEPAPPGQLLIYNDGGFRLQVRLDGHSVWLTQAQIAALYQTTPQNITLHISGIYADGELPKEGTCKGILQVGREGSRQVRRVRKHYSLDMILAIGYRVRSHRGTSFRQWATTRLRDLLVKGFTLDDERIKAGRTIGADYFDELLARIRDIRASERLFYQKITDIYSTSIDYDPEAETTRLFFQTVQNKVHWAAHGHTAAEIVRMRSDATRPNMGLTSWRNGPSGPIRKYDAAVAKNYLNREEIDALNLIVTAYLDFAELQARSHRPMHMSDWISKLDDFLRLSERDILTHAGRISHSEATAHAHTQYAEYERQRREWDEASFSDFDEAATRIASQSERRSRRRRRGE